MRLLMLLAALMLYVPSVWALSSVNRDFNELVTLADEVVVGTVNDIRSYWRTPAILDTIETNIVLNQLEVLKGSITENTYIVNIAGGHMPPYSVLIPGAPEFKLHQRYVLFIKDNQRAIFPFVGVTNGIFIVDRTPEGRSVMKSLSGEVVTAISAGDVHKQAVSTKGLGSQMGMSFETFRSHVQQRLLPTMNSRSLP